LPLRAVPAIARNIEHVVGFEGRGVIAERLVAQLPIEEDIQTGKIHLHHRLSRRAHLAGKMNPADAILLF